MIEHLPVNRDNGGVFQSGVPTRVPSAAPLAANGLMLRGVVVATYVLDDETHPQAQGTNRGGPVAVYCDVITYGSRAGSQTRLLKQCLVLQRRGGLHDGDIWLPKATTKDVTGPNNLDRNVGGNSSYWDGDHVLVGFMDDNFSLPIIVGGIPHPSADAGVEAQGAAGEQRRRLKLRQVDAHPDYTKHHGSYYGIDNLGNHIVDTRFANDGTLGDYGAEAAPPGPSDADRGNQILKTPSGAKWELTLEDMSNPASPQVKATLTIEDGKLHLVFASGFELLVDDDATTINLGDNSERATIDDLLQGELDRIKDDIDNLKWEIGRHRHPVTEFPAPLIFGDVTETFRQPALYGVKTDPPVNIRTGYDCAPNNALQDKDAGSGEYFGVGTGPTTADVLTGGSTPGPTHSNTVNLKA
jgi:hypothetical protein